MNRKEAEALVAKNLPEWAETASSNFEGFAQMLVEDYKNWAHDTLESTMGADLTEEEYDALSKLSSKCQPIISMPCAALCRPVPSFKTADGVTCYVGDLVYCKDGKKYEVTEVLSEELVRAGEFNAPFAVANLCYYEPEAPKSLKAVRAEKQAERKQAERKAATEFEKKVRRDMLAALNDRGSFHERLLWELTEANGYIGIKTSMDESDWETFLDTDAGAEAVAWWESRDVRFKISEWEKGVILYVDGVNSNTFHCTCFDFKTWGEYQHLAR